MAAADYNNKVQAYFVAFLGRPASSSELAQYSEALNANSGSVWTSGLNAYLAGLAGLTADKPTLSAAGDMVTAMFQNITGNASMDMTNYNFYVGQLLSGSIKPRGLANAMLNDFGLMPRNDGTYTRPNGWPTTKTVTAEEKAALEAKVDFAGDFTAAIDTPAEDQALGAAPAAAKNLLATVTSAATAATAASSIASTIASTVESANTVAGQPFTLTTSLDTGAKFTGTSAADTFSGIDTGLATTTTVNTGDSLNGGAGTDRLEYSTSGAVAGGAIVATTDIEELSVFNNSTVAYTVNASLMAGLKDVYVTGGSSAVTVSAGTTAPNLHLISTNQNATVAPIASAVVGGADKATILSNGSATTQNITATYNGLETIDFVAAGTTGSSGATPTTLTLSSDSLSTLNMTGSAARVAAALPGATATVTGTVTSDSGAHDVAITADATDKLSVSMGAGDDAVRIANIAATHTIAGGDGTDTLATSASITTTTGANISGFEAVEIGAGASVALPTATNPVATLTIRDAGGGTLTGLASGGTINLTTGGGATVTNTAWTAGTADSLTVKVGTSTTTGALAASAISATGIETAVINNLAQGSDTSTRTVGVTSSSLKSLTVDGQGAVTITGGGVALTKIDASAVQGAVTFSATTAAAGAELIAGVGNDAITGGTGNDTLTAGAGNDTITGGVGADKLTGGAGTDTFVFAANAAGAVVSSLAAPDQIADFVSGTDKISVAQAVTDFLGNYTTLGAAQAAANIDGRTNLAYFVSGDNALYVVATPNANPTATDTVITFAPGTVTSLTRGDLGFGSQGTGNSISLTAASANVSNTLSTNASGTTSALDDSISTTATRLVGSTIDGGAGNDTLTVSTSDAGIDISAVVSNVERIVYTLGNTGALVLPSTSGLGVSSSSATAAFTVNLGGASQTVTTATSGTTTVQMAGQGSSVTATGSGSVTVTAFGATGGAAVTGQVVTTSGGTGAATVTFGAGATGGTFTGSATAADTVILADSTYTNLLILSAGTTTGVNDILEAPDAATTINISAATVTGFEILDLDSAGARVHNVTMTPTQLAQFTGTNRINGTDDVITLSTTGTVNAQPVLLNYVLANGSAGNTFNAHDSALSISVTGGNAASTYNFGTRLDGNDTITGTAGSDTLVITGSGTGSATVTAIETIQFTTSTAAQTFTTGATALAASGTITAAASTVALTIDATNLNATTAATIIDGPGADTIIAPETVGERGITIVNLSSGGADTVRIDDLVHLAGGTDGLTIRNFTAGSGTGADILNLKLADTAGDLDYVGDYINVSSAATAVTVSATAGNLTVIEINSSVAMASSLTDVAAGGAVEAAIAVALGTVTAAGPTEAIVILYGSGAASGNAGIYSAVLTNGADATAANTAVELIGILEGVAADAITPPNIG